MKIEILYVSECPSHLAAVRLVRDVLAAQGIAADIHEILVADDKMAHELRFIGSPTIRINGRDVSEEKAKPKAFALTCRLYPGSQKIGLPPAEMVHRAVIEERKGDR